MLSKMRKKQITRKRQELITTIILHLGNNLGAKTLINVYSEENKGSQCDGNNQQEQQQG